MQRLKWLVFFALTLALVLTLCACDEVDGTTNNLPSDEEPQYTFSYGENNTTIVGIKFSAKAIESKEPIEIVFPQNVTTIRLQDDQYRVPHIIIGDDFAENIANPLAKQMEAMIINEFQYQLFLNNWNCLHINDMNSFAQLDYLTRYPFLETLATEVNGKLVYPSLYILREDIDQEHLKNAAEYLKSINYDASCAYQYIKAALAKKNITEIPDEFLQFIPSHVTSVKLPSNLKSLVISTDFPFVSWENHIAYVDKWAIGFDKNMPVDSISLRSNTVGLATKTFANCDFTNITIPDGVTRIDNFAFGDCSNRIAIYYDGTAEDWDNISIAYNIFYATEATIYYYAEDGAPDTTGNYWHYDENGNPVAW